MVAMGRKLQSHPAAKPPDPGGLPQLILKVGPKVDAGQAVEKKHENEDEKHESLHSYQRLCRSYAAMLCGY